MHPEFRNLDIGISAIQNEALKSALDFLKSAIEKLKKVRQTQRMVAAYFTQCYNNNNDNDNDNNDNNNNDDNDNDNDNDNNEKEF